jgi:hypothetical protein
LQQFCPFLQYRLTYVVTSPLPAAASGHEGGRNSRT